MMGLAPYSSIVTTEYESLISHTTINFQVYAEVKQLNIREPETESLEERLAKLEQITERSLYNIEALLRGAVFQRGMSVQEVPLPRQAFHDPADTTDSFSTSGIPYYTDYNRFK